MLEGFALYKEPILTNTIHATVGVPPHTRLKRIIRTDIGWLLWVATRDYIFGTYFLLYDSGRVERITCREDEGDDIMVIRPSDEEIRSKVT
jgi:hypothetical protein